MTADNSACPILERTGDGTAVGRCWHHCPEGLCPRHGDVGQALELYKSTGDLTDEFDHDPDFAVQVKCFKER